MASIANEPNQTLLTIAGLETIYVYYEKGSPGLTEVLSNKNTDELYLGIVGATLFLNARLASLVGGQPIEILELVAWFFLNEQSQPSGTWTPTTVDNALDAMRVLIAHERETLSRLEPLTAQGKRLVSAGAVVIATTLCLSLSDKLQSNPVEELLRARQDFIDLFGEG